MPSHSFTTQKHTFLGYPPVIIATEHGLFIDDLPIDFGDFP